MNLTIHLKSARGAIHVIAPVIIVAAITLIGMRLLTISHAATATATYYISPTGDDTNNGLSENAAWKTISHVDSQHFNPGDSILFQGGSTFSGKLYFPPKESGTAA